MAHSPRTRFRAQELFTNGWSLERIASELGVAKSTLARWSTKGNWSALREARLKLEQEAVGLALEMARSARESRDPQQAYAASLMAKLAGVGEERVVLRPVKVAEALLDVVAKHPDVGPVLRRHRGEVLRDVVREVERLEREQGLEVPA